MALTVALLSTTIGIDEYDAADAHRSIRRAVSVGSVAPAAGLRSLALRETRAFGTERGERQTEVRLWYQQPRRWRVETLAVGNLASLSVSDGATVWDYDVRAKTVTVNPIHPGQDVVSPLMPFGRAAADLQEVLRQARSCFDVNLLESEKVAGRKTHLLDLSPGRCPGFDRRRRIWVDRETFLVLKEIGYRADGGVEYQREVTHVDYNPRPDPGLFTFTPPPGAAVYDTRPQPPPSPGEYGAMLGQLARQFDFPLFAPRWLPPGYAPLPPRQHPFGVELIYALIGEAGTVSPEPLHSLSLFVRKATPSHAAEVPARAEPIRVGGVSGWYQPGIRQPGGLGSSNRLTLMREGTWIAISSFVLGKEELVRVAESLEPVPGGHPPLPNPRPRTLAEVRSRVSFPVFVPTDVPAGLTAEPPVGGEAPDHPVQIAYHTPDGAVALHVISGPAGCCLAADPRKTGEPVQVRGSIEGHLLPGPPQVGGPILWWQEAGAYIALSGPNLTKEQLLRIAGSRSSTAVPPHTELPPARPAPPPVPPPRFRVLRPAWLPELAQLWEEYVPGPPEHGSGVRLSFDPRPGDRPHDVLSLLELPAAAAPEVIRDPSATRERIAGREVTVIRRNEGCVTLFWVQGGVALRLTNAWDPPGSLRYSCEQMRRIVESVR